jgi:ATP-dependent exoDNAse (exonuclease V) alpha subunit
MKNSTIKESLTPHQLELFNTITTQLEDIVETGMVWDNMMALSGAAGTGKTYLTTAIVEYLHSKYHVTITAPTHKALKVIAFTMYNNDIKNISTKTIHSFLNIKLFTDYDKGIQKFIPSESKKDINKTDILIVDESSMVSDALYGFIMDAIEHERVKAVLFVGDYYQLLPIDSGKNSVFSVRHQYKLKEIVRQAKDSYIIKVASAVRTCIKTKKYTDLKTFFKQNMDVNISFFHNQDEFLEDFYKGNDWAEREQVIGSFKNDDVDAYNRMVRKKYWQEKGMEVTSTLLKGDKIVFQSAYSINGVQKYANNDEITLSYAQKKHSDILNIEYWECKDTEESEDQEIIKIVDTKSLSVFNDKLAMIAKIARKEKNYKKRKEMWEHFFALKEFFADVKYTFASTIHKLQGSTYETVYIDLFALSHNQHIDMDQLYRLVYVAMTRASKDIKILIPAFSSINIESIEDDFQMLFGDLNF